jgi:hypothetical protein
LMYGVNLNRAADIDGADSPCDILAHDRVNALAEGLAAGLGNGLIGGLFFGPMGGLEFGLGLGVVFALGSAWGRLGIARLWFVARRQGGCSSRAPARHAGRVGLHAGRWWC